MIPIQIAGKVAMFVIHNEISYNVEWIVTSPFRVPILGRQANVEYQIS